MWRASFILLAVAVAVAAVLVLVPRPDGYFYGYREFAQSDAPLMAHAGGATGDGRYSNSLEANEASYRSGIRWFEADLELTTDGEVVLLHDLGRTWKYWFNAEEPVSLAEFEARRMRGGRTPLSLASYCKWLASRRVNAFLHIRRPEVLKRSAKCPDRTIGFVDTPSLADDARTAGFTRIAVNLWTKRSNIEQIEADYIVMWNREYSLAEIASVARSRRVVVPTVNDPGEALALTKAGVAAVMTDVLRPSPT